uniref:Alpha-type protein kinase domain-containing protein n=1 Tax=Guillardia theta TaxID=55529 RepID=A0A7S4JYM2_GUITH|mmetsp:Transcript_1966/g.5918  ORF Transcript_1966/g.5918 Transcript_1966/m.5918 type:complete len:557 (+) Transcript_1966:124-1794(+)
MEGALRAWYDIPTNQWRSCETNIVVEDQVEEQEQRHPRYVVRDEGTEEEWIFGERKVMRVLLSASEEEEEDAFDSIKANEIARHCAAAFSSRPSFSSCFQPFRFVLRYALILTSRPDAPLAVVETAVPSYLRLQVEDKKAGVDASTAFSLFTLRFTRGRLLLYRPRVVFPGVWKKPALASRKKIGGRADRGEEGMLSFLWSLEPNKSGVSPSPSKQNSTEERLLALLSAGANAQDKEELHALVLKDVQPFVLELNATTPVRSKSNRLVFSWLLRVEDISGDLDMWGRKAFSLQQVSSRLDDCPTESAFRSEYRFEPDSFHTSQVRVKLLSPTSPVESSFHFLLDLSKDEIFVLWAVASGQCEFGMSCTARNHFFGEALAERFNQIRSSETSKVTFKRRFIFHIMSQHVETFFTGESIVLHSYKDDILIPEQPLYMISSHAHQEDSFELAQQRLLFSLFQLYVYFTSHRTILVTRVALTEGRWSDPVFHFAVDTDKQEFQDLEEELLTSFDPIDIDLLSKCDGPLHFKRQMGLLMDSLMPSEPEKHERNFRHKATIA